MQAALLCSWVTHAPPRGRLGTGLHMCDEPDRQALRQLVQRDRLARRAGLLAGASFIGGGLAVGQASGVLDPGPLLGVIGVLGALAVANTLSFEESRPRLPPTHFAVAPSAGKGDGLFAQAPIEAGAFLFAYEGEALDEDALFERYPSGDGRYIACITDSLYVDGCDPSKSNEARWINHASPQNANLRWKKQRFGPRPAMRFYAQREIAAGEELTFDYKAEYWEALGVTPQP